MNDRTVPDNGIFKLWRKLPGIISIAAQMLPETEALSQMEFNGLYTIDSTMEIYVFKLNHRE